MSKLNKIKKVSIFLRLGIPKPKRENILDFNICT